LRKIIGPSKVHVAFSAREDPKLRALLERAGLVDSTCLVDQLNLKPAGVGTGFPFHQDLRFLIGKRRNGSSSTEGLT